MMTKNAQVLNASATKFKVPSHASERKELGEARVGAGRSLQGLVPFKIWLDTTLDCIELTREMY